MQILQMRAVKLSRISTKAQVIKNFELLLLGKFHLSTFSLLSPASISQICSLGSITPHRKASLRGELDYV
jgi:hypothetical protein